MNKLERGELMRLIALGIAVVLEGAALVSVILNITLVPIKIYPSVVSVAVFVLPSIVGLLARRLEVAVLLALLPFYTLAVVYSILFQPVWNVDLFTLGVLVQRVANTSVLLGVLAVIGWLLRRVFLRQPVVRPARA
ncbi:MAG TPA: hypothetical protein VGS80_04660 [Ktedonobacterales bacterium]|jgi:hypothetical protein|nr:hypothetical protein [Ktedonobacterales bacterium]